MEPSEDIGAGTQTNGPTPCRKRYTLLRDQKTISVQVRFQGGANKAFTVPVPPRCWELRRTNKKIIEQIDQLLDDHTDGEIAHILNEREWRSSSNNPFTLRIIQTLRRNYTLPSRYDRLRARGLMSAKEIAKLIHSNPLNVKYWRRQGLLNGVKFDEKNQSLYEIPEKGTIDLIMKRRGQKRSSHCKSSQPGAV